MRETWYVLESKGVVNPNDCALDEHGVLRHGTGVAVAMRGDVYSSRGVDVDEKGNLISPFETPSPKAAEKTDGGGKPPVLPPVDDKKDMEAQPRKPAAAKPGYKTRDQKAK